jgi:hypothetical protein
MEADIDLYVALIRGAAVPVGRRNGNVADYVESAASLFH